MKPAWSVLLFTTLAGAGQGLFLAVFLAGGPAAFGIAGGLLALLLAGAGLAASFFHLGRPERAWRAAAMWRTSWLSREVIVLPLFLFLAALYVIGLWLRWPAAGLIGMLAAVAAVVLFICTAMIYACLPFLQEWRSPYTVANFFLLGCASGLTAAAALAAWLHPAFTGIFAWGALGVGVAGYLSRLLSFARNKRLRPKSTLATALGARGGPIRQISQGSMGGTYTTREFFHGRPERVVRAVRWTFLALGFPAPALLIFLSEGNAAALAAAFVVQYAGLVAERWYFFAEARHPQNLYYQVIS